MIGGFFAPPLTDELLAKYKTQLDALPASALKDALNVLLNCCNQWWQQPDSPGAGTLHPTGAAIVVPLSPDIAKALDEHIPWKEELDAIHKLCDAIPADQVALRNCAFHLLWHAMSLETGHEPMTNDKLLIPVAPTK